MVQRSGTILAVFIILIFTPKLAFAYIDPGTGSMLIQGAIGAIAAGLVVGKLYWHKFKTWLGLERSQVVAPEHKEDEESGAS